MQALFFKYPMSNTLADKTFLQSLSCIANSEQQMNFTLIFDCPFESDSLML